MDETAASLDPYLMRGWRKRGSQTHVCASAGSHAMLQLFGGIDLLSGEVASLFSQTRKSSDFIAFLEELMRRRYPTQNVILILDNASFHKSVASRAALALFAERLRTFFLPPYTPELNPIERYWRHLKQTALGNRFCHTIQQVEQLMQAQLTAQNDLTCTSRFHV